MAAASEGLLLDALADQVELGPGQRDHVQRIHHRDRIRDHLGGFWVSHVMRLIAAPSAAITLFQSTAPEAGRSAATHRCP
jgi:hypothetical protein